MQLVLERRAERSAVIAVVSPLLAVALTLVTFAVLFTIMGKNPINALFRHYRKSGDRFSSIAARPSLWSSEARHSRIA